MSDWVKEGFDHLAERPEMVVPSKFVASVHQICLKFIMPLSITSVWKRHNLKADVQETKEIN